MNCPDCRAPLKEAHGFYARFLRGRLRLSRSLRCTQCRFAAEEDSDGVVPAEIRIQLLADGAWGIRGAEERTLARAVASILNRRAVEVFKCLVDDGGATPIGLQAEAEWVAHRLVGSKVEVVRINAADGIFALGEGP